MPRLEGPDKIKLLTCSASDYAKNQRRDLSAYEFIELDEFHGSLKYAKEGIRSRAYNADCEVVTDIRHLSDEHKNYYIFGTGLRLKKEGEEDNPRGDRRNA